MTEGIFWGGVANCTHWIDINSLRPVRKVIRLNLRYVVQWDKLLFSQILTVHVQFYALRCLPDDVGRDTVHAAVILRLDFRYAQHDLRFRFRGRCRRFCSRGNYPRDAGAQPGWVRTTNNDICLDFILSPFWPNVRKKWRFFPADVPPRKRKNRLVSTLQMCRTCRSAHSSMLCKVHQLAQSWCGFHPKGRGLLLVFWLECEAWKKWFEWMKFMWKILIPHEFWFHIITTALIGWDETLIPQGKMADLDVDLFFLRS